MKKLTIIPILCMVLFAASSALAWEMTWQNITPWFGPDGVTPIAPGGMIQLIADGGDGVVADPMTVLTTPALVLEWIAAGCPAIGAGFHPELGDDVLVSSSDAVNPTQFLDYGPGFDGYFDGTYINAGLPAGTQLYTRFFTAEGPDLCDYYGTIGATDGVGDFYVLPDEAFPLYIFEGAATADTHIFIPEPATMLIGGVALLLSFFRRKK